MDVLVVSTEERYVSRSCQLHKNDLAIKLQKYEQYLGLAIFLISIFLAKTMMADKGIPKIQSGGWPNAVRKGLSLLSGHLFSSLLVAHSLQVTRTCRIRDWPPPLNVAIQSSGQTETVGQTFFAAVPYSSHIRPAHRENKTKHECTIGK
jgi:hypothetical protein